MSYRGTICYLISAARLVPICGVTGFAQPRLTRAAVQPSAAAMASSTASPLKTGNVPSAPRQTSKTPAVDLSTREFSSWVLTLFSISITM